MQDLNNENIEQAQESPLAVDGQSNESELTPGQFLNGNDLGVELTLGSGFTVAETISAVKYELEAGRITKEQANEMLAADGIAPLSDPSHFDKEFPPVDPGKYRIPIAEGEITKDTIEFVKSAQGWLSEGRFDAGIGTFMAEEADRISDQLEKLSPQDKILWEKSQINTLHNIYKGDFTRNIELARQLVSEIEARRPGLVKYLEDTGAGNSMMVVHQFVQQALRLDARYGK